MEKIINFKMLRMIIGEHVNDVSNFNAVDMFLNTRGGDDTAEIYRIKELCNA